MQVIEKQLKDWSNTFANPPKLNQQEAGLVSLLAVIFLVMAILQLAGFNDFKEVLSGLGLSSPGTWAVIVIIAEILAAIGFLRVKLNGLVRFFGGVFAVFAAGFWFVENLQAVASKAVGEVSNSGFFGKYLVQQPGWWTVVEASVLVFWVVYALRLSKQGN